MSAIPRPKPWEINRTFQAEALQEEKLDNITELPHQTDKQSNNDQNTVPPRPLVSPLASNKLSPPFTTDQNTLDQNSVAYGNLNYNIPSIYGNASSVYNRLGGPMPYGNNLGSFYNNGYYGGIGAPDYSSRAINPQGDATQSTFQLIEGLIGTVSGFAQMLESTYMATHNSFYTMLSVAEQFNYLKEMLGSVFGVFTLIKFLKKVLYKITNGRMGSNPRYTQQDTTRSNLLDEFFKYQKTGTLKSAHSVKKISWKPLIFFLAAVFGFPYVLDRFIKRIQNSVVTRDKISVKSNDLSNIDNIEFARALYDFVPEDPHVEAELKKGDLMAILSKQDPIGQNSEWYKVRTKGGQVGYVPYNYLEIIKKKINTKG